MRKTNRVHSVSLGTLLYIASQNLLSKKLRTGLTLLGIVIGIGAVYFLVSFGIGLQRVVTDQVLGSQSVKTITVTTPNSKIIKLDAEGAKRIKDLPHVTQLSTSFTYPGALSFKNSDVESIVYGIDEAYQDMTQLNLVEGKLLNDKKIDQAVINISILETMGINDSRDILGKKVALKIPLATAGVKQKSIDKTFTISGVIDSGSGNEIFIPKFSFEAAGVPVYSELRLTSDSDISLMPNLRKQIESMGYRTNSPIDTINQINQIFQVFTYMLFGFGMVGMIVAVLGMLNTLTVSLLERTREVGLMIALGARAKDMHRLFIMEATLLSVIGSVIGIVVAMAAGVTVNTIMNMFASGRGVSESFSVFANPLWLIIACIGVMTLVGWIVAYLPARRARRIDPVDALRRY